jgi:major membrane immunogen (membrane-anchored lipoprotein)
MKKFALLLALTSGTLCLASVSVSSPANGGSVGTPVQYVATATTTCAKGVAAMGIYSAPGVLAYSTLGSSLNTELTLAPGEYQTEVQEWDNCGGASKTPITIYVSAGGGAGVQVASPANNSNVGDPVQYVANATTGCSKGVAAMGIYTAPGVLAYVTNGASLNTELSLNSGTYNTVVQEWDNCGGFSKTPITITVSGGGGGAFSMLQAGQGWTGYALEPPSYNICTYLRALRPADHLVDDPEYFVAVAQRTLLAWSIGGQTVYSDVLWNNHLIGNSRRRVCPTITTPLSPACTTSLTMSIFTSKIPASRRLWSSISISL